MSLSTKELSRWSRLENSRRAGSSALPFFISSVTAAIVFFYFFRASAAAGTSNPAGLSREWFFLAAAAHVIVFFRAPFRLYWHRDSKLLARLPIDGDQLFGLSLSRAINECILVAIPACAAAAGFIGLDAIYAVRHLLLAGVLFLFTALFAPCLALFAGAAVANDKTQAAIAAMGGEFAAPRNSLLGALPAVGATAMILTVAASGDWSTGGYPVVSSIHIIWAIGLGVPLISLFFAYRSSAATMPAALREVSSLDQERLAHVERTEPSALERLWIRMTMPAAQALVAEKDARSLRRRFPLPYFLMAVATLTLWGVAILQPDTHVTTGSIILVTGTLYAAVMRRRVDLPPIEQSRLATSLAPGPSAFTSAKRRFALLRLGTFWSLGGIPWALRSTEYTTWFVFPALVVLYLVVTSILIRGARQ